MEFQIESGELHLFGGIRRDNLNELVTVLTEYIKNQEDNVILDLTDVDTMDTMALQVLIAAKRTTKQANKNFKLLNINQVLEEIFEVSGMDAVFENSIDRF